MTTGKKADGFAWVFLSSSIACGAGEDTVRRSVHENVGAICLTQTDAEVTINADFGVCLNGLCNYTEPAPRCQASFEDGRIMVTSRLDLASDASPGVNCLDECAPAKAGCGFIVAAEGEVRVVYGVQEATVRLPLTRATPLFGDYPCPEQEP
jgi:hypothetical protein